MQLSPGRFRIRSAAVLVGAALLVAPLPLAAQPDTSNPDAPSKAYFNRILIGARLSILFNDLMNTETLSSSTSEPVFRLTNATTSTSNQLGAGGAFEFALLERLSIALELVYRKAGYKSNLETSLGETDPVVTRRFERTRTDYWDLPIVLRFYDASRSERPSRTFLEAGLALRRVTHIRTFSEVLLPDKTSAISEAAAVPRNSTLPGVVLGGGFQLAGSSPVKVIPQIRYTRWLGNTFNSPPTVSRRNQFELLLGIAF